MTPVNPSSHVGVRSSSISQTGPRPAPVSRKSERQATTGRRSTWAWRFDSSLMAASGGSRSTSYRRERANERHA